MNNIYILGYMGSGKSTIGKKLAKKLNTDFIDLDKYIETKENKSIAKIFELQGETEFRKIEKESLLEISRLENKIISLGGGTPCFLNNMKIINNSGLSVYLKMPIGMLVSRLINAKIQRPLIKDKNREELHNFIEKQLKEREEFYSMSSITFNAISVNIDELVSSISQNQ